MGTSNEAVGNVGNSLHLAFTLVITSCMLYQLPSPDYFDQNWLSAGFCVSNPSSLWLNSHSLSFYADCVLATILWILFQTAPPKTKENELQLAILKGSIFGVFGHGLGHMYYGLSPDGLMDVRWQPADDLVRSVANIAVTLVTFFAIFNGAMPLASTNKVLTTTAVSTAGFTFFDIKPHLNFVYTQGVIYVFVGIHMIFGLGKEHKATKSYAMYPYLQFPTLLIGVLEATRCSSFLSKFGGHVLFDISIAMGLIATELVARSKPKMA